MADNVPMTGDAAWNEDDDLFLLANLFPRDTGLRTTVWLTAQGDPWPDPHIKVSPTPGERAFDRDGPAIVALHPAPHCVRGALEPDDLQRACSWTALNTGAIMAYWSGKADTFELVRRLQRLPG